MHTILFFLIVLLAGCTTSRYKDARFDEDSYNPQKKGVVIVKTYSMYQKKLYRVLTYWGYDDDGYLTDAKKSYAFEESLIKTAWRFVPGYMVARLAVKEREPVDYDVYQLPAGRYLLDGFYSIINDVRYTTDQDDGWSERRKEPNWAGFRVRAGEVLYIGDIQFYFSQNKGGISVQNNLKDAQKYLRDNYPWIKGDIRAKLLKVAFDKRYSAALGNIGPPPPAKD